MMFIVQMALNAIGVQETKYATGPENWKRLQGKNGLHPLCIWGPKANQIGWVGI